MKIQTGTILIVDDDPDYARVVQLLLARFCPQLSTVTLRSGPELISYLQGEDRFSGLKGSSGPVLVLLDVRMPGMDGFEVLRWLRDHPPHHLLPVIVLTSCGEIELAQRAYALGARSFLAKPLGIEEFENMVREFQQWLVPAHMAIPPRQPDFPIIARS
jgi:two-component system response regulator